MGRRGALYCAPASRGIAGADHAGAADRAASVPTAPLLAVNNTEVIYDQVILVTAHRRRDIV